MNNLTRYSVVFLFPLILIIMAIAVAMPLLLLWSWALDINILLKLTEEAKELAAGLITMYIFLTAFTALFFNNL